MSVADGTSVIPPGWYPDPADAARLRRWDGQQWTQEVILAPDDEPAEQARVDEPEPVAPQPAPVQPAAAQPVILEPIILEPVIPQPVDAQPTAPLPPQSAPGQPPLGQPVPASPAPTIAPPGQPPATEAPGQPTIPRPSPPVNQHPNPSSGPVSLPEWANLPGLTLPPDLSSLPGMETDSVLNRPTFAEPEQRELPTLPVFEPPFIPQRPDVQEVGRPRAETAPPQPTAPPLPAAPYAPPPAGAQYDVPPPPGMAHVPTAGPVLPPSAFVAPPAAPTGWPLLPPVEPAPPTVAAPAPAPAGFERTTASRAQNVQEPESSLSTISSWLIGVLPLLQFGAIYLIFKVLNVELAPTIQWGLLLIPAAFSLLFANADRKKLASLDAPAPSVIFGLIPPLYLIVRCFTTGRSSVLPLAAWVILQAASAAGVYFLLPTILASAIHSFG